MIDREFALYLRLYRRLEEIVENFENPVINAFEYGERCDSPQCPFQ